ncbi:MAG: hypothetical protein JXR48_11315 [Candidatus Delongbacteria bacterium]|nr:hypothetical protein [Candidatus Delongbacteria bacterium]MBN2835542.1 hypothetical protein [Candidatus Delongbacteria bacterium]
MITRIFTILILCISLYSDYIIKDFGVKSGLSISKDKFDVLTGSALFDLLVGSEFDYRYGFTGGFFCEFFDEPYFNLLLSIEYIQKGTKLKNSHEYDNRLDYLSFPLGIKLKYPDYKFLPYLLFAYRYEFIFNKSIETNLSLYHDAKIGNMGTSVGFGFEFDFGGVPAQLEYLYHTQYSSLLESDHETYTGNNLCHSITYGVKLKELFTQRKRNKIDYINEADRIVSNDLNISFIDNDENNEISKNLSKNDIIVRSMLFPGLGHYSQGKYFRGIIHTSIFALSVLTSTYIINEYNSKVDHLSGLKDSFDDSYLYYDSEQFKAKYKNYKQKVDDYRIYVYAGFSIVGISYLAGIIDNFLILEDYDLSIESTDNSPGIKLGINL